MCSSLNITIKAKTINNMFLRHFISQNDAGGQDFFNDFFKT